MRRSKYLLNRQLARPWIYTSFSRFLLALTAALLMDLLIPHPETLNFKMYVFMFLGILFAALAWIAYLRLDGVRLPKLMMKRVNIRKKPARGAGDMIDYVDEQPPITFEDLEENEKDVCILWADLACFVVFTLLSFLV